MPLSKMVPPLFRQVTFASGEQEATWVQLRFLGTDCCHYRTSLILARGRTIQPKFGQQLPEECRELREALERERDLEEDLVRMTRFEELGAREILKLKSDFLDLEIHHSAILKLDTTQKAQDEQEVEAQAQKKVCKLLTEVALLKSQIGLLPPFQQLPKHIVMLEVVAEVVPQPTLPDSVAGTDLELLVAVCESAPVSAVAAAEESFRDLFALIEV
ncbi:hypothetical protein BDR26DRAFT_940775 [Obelidium mucronatum]|nr:hypothetical protein BDR26DRAFT_940775 [Obelidium mucronatum]